MDKITFEVPSFNVSIYPFENATVEVKKLLLQAIQAREKWDQPVSKFHVWAAIQVTGCQKSIYIWANCENVNFNGSTHAEQCAINNALMEKSDNIYGSMKIESIGVVWAMHNIHYNDIKTMTTDLLSSTLQKKTQQEIMDSFCTPCGHCRQIIAPYSTENTKLYLLNPAWIISEMPFRNIIPFPFLEIK